MEKHPYSQDYLMTPYRINCPPIEPKIPYDWNKVKFYIYWWSLALLCIGTFVFVITTIFQMLVSNTNQKFTYSFTSVKSYRNAINGCLEKILLVSNTWNVVTRFKKSFM